MNYFLKNYFLTNDIMRINQQDNFHPAFTTQDIDSLILTVTDYSTYLSTLDPLQLFFVNLQAIQGKDIYTLLKWVIVIHKAIHLVRYPNVLTNIYNSLNKITIYYIADPYEEYVSQKLVKPYIIFLQKLCLLQQKKSITNTLKNQRNFNQQMHFIQYNFIKFGLFQLKHNFFRFSSFFKECYPYLHQYQGLIQQDLMNQFSQLKNGLKKDQSASLLAQDINKLAKKLDFSCQEQLQTEPFVVTEFTSQKKSMVQLFQSGSKDNQLSSALFLSFQLIDA